jgi:Co/Zn/Cd efflux system component
MVVEFVTGLVHSSKALLPNGLHIASHTTALRISLLAYGFARRLAADPRFAFGVDKVR